MLSSVLKVNVRDGSILVFAWVPGPIPSQHLLQDLYPPAHPGPVRQQPQGLHPTGSQAAYCPPQTQQDCYTTTSGRSWSVHLFLLKGVTSRGKMAKKHRKCACLFYSRVAFSNIYALYFCGHLGKMSVIYPCFSWVGWGEGGLENEERVGVCIILLGGFLLWGLPSEHVV